MPEMLPTFRYHPDPLATGSVRPDQSTPCACCGKARGYIYTASVYGPGALRGRLCPWCIASGSAALKFDCSFVASHPLKQARLPRPLILEVTRKTPGYSSWQQEEWQVCCDDACEFHGDATKEELVALTGDSLARVLKSWDLKPDYWPQLLDDYQPKGMASVFRFICRHCHHPRYSLDLA